MQSVMGLLYVGGYGRKWIMVVGTGLAMMTEKSFNIVGK